jgi:5,10-methylenetetrahydromethanopterin reductase
MNMRIGIGVGAGTGADGTIDTLLDQIKQAEADGFHSAWMANIFSHDAITLLSLAGRVTHTIELGTFVVPTYPRHPLALAQQALTASAATDGRFTLGIGLSHKVVIENMMGLDYSKPVRHMREYLSCLAPLLRGEPVRFRGEEYRVAGQVLVPGSTPPPVLVAALGPQMLKLTGTMADGTATWMGGPKYLEHTAIPTITAAAREAGRPAPRIAAGFPVAVTSKVDAARESAAKIFQVYGTLPSYRAALDIEGATDASSVAIVGNEDEVMRQVRHLADIGVTDFNASIFPVRGDDDVHARTYDCLKEMAASAR